MCNVVCLLQELSTSTILTTLGLIALLKINIIYISICGGRIEHSNYTSNPLSLASYFQHLMLTRNRENSQNEYFTLQVDNCVLVLQTLNVSSFLSYFLAVSLIKGLVATRLINLSHCNSFLQVSVDPHSSETDLHIHA